MRIRQPAFLLLALYEQCNVWNAVFYEECFGKKHFLKLEPASRFKNAVMS